MQTQLVGSEANVHAVYVPNGLSDVGTSLANVQTATQQTCANEVCSTSGQHFTNSVHNPTLPQPEEWYIETTYSLTVTVLISTGLYIHVYI